MAISYDELFRTNPDAPKDAEAIKNLARRVYVPFNARGERGFGMTIADQMVHFEASDTPQSDSCGEYSRGLIDLALASEVLTPNDKDEIQRVISDSQPSLEKDKKIEHFHFHWTEQSTDASDNVTEPDIDATGAELNALFDKYSNEFRMPKAELRNNERVIDVNVYFDGGLYGSTSSFSNEIFLNSRDVVRDGCRRRTTSAHELFHRVEYSYGYVTGTPGQRWWVEALGSWSQKYAHPDQQDYVRRVEAGLNNTGRGLLVRSYDAVHFWKYFGERLKDHGTFAEEFEAVREFMTEHDDNGNDALAACTTVASKLNANRSFDSLFAEWAMANYAKDFTGTPFGYTDNAFSTTNCGRNYGPYAKILPAVDIQIQSDSDSYSSPTQFVNQYGTDYFKFQLDSSVTTVKVEVNANPNGGNGELAVAFITTNNANLKSAASDFDNGKVTRNLDVQADGIGEFVVAVSAVSGGGSEYTVNINSQNTGTT